MKRREFIAGSVAFFAGASSAHATAADSWRISQIIGGPPELDVSTYLAQGLSDLGYIDGKNIRLQTSFTAPTLIDMKAGILALLPDTDLLVTWGTIGGVAAKATAANIPVVFISVGAPVEIGLVESLSHPGGNMTGITFEAATETYAKRLQLLKEAVPSLAHVAVIGAENDPNVPFAMLSLEKFSPSLGVALTLIEINSSADLIGAFEQIKRERLDAVLIVAGVLTAANSKSIADLALANGLPSCHGFKETVAAGGLISLGPDYKDLARQGASLVDKIIKGRHPADLPVEQPTRYVMSINLKTAKALGLSISPALLASADEVIE